VIKQQVYTSYDLPAENAGGKMQLMQQIARTCTLDSTINVTDTKFAVAFVVNKNGEISGKRIVSDKIGGVGKTMIEIAKSFRWTPAKYNGKNVATVVELSMQLDTIEN
jgi:hypothetical protein